MGSLKCLVWSGDQQSSTNSCPLWSGQSCQHKQYYSSQKGWVFFGSPSKGDAPVGAPEWMITNRVILAPIVIVFITIIAISLIQKLFLCV